MTRFDTNVLPGSVGSLRHTVSSTTLREALVTILLALYFPLLLVLMIGLPLVLANQYGLSMEYTIQASLFLGALGYVFGFLVLFR